MTKSEFLAQENVPEFIKAIVASLPGDADVEIESFKLGKPQKKESCSCDRVHENGVDISAYVEGIGDRVVALIELSDCKGQLYLSWRTDGPRYGRSLRKGTGVPAEVGI